MATLLTSELLAALASNLTSDVIAKLGQVMRKAMTGTGKQKALRRSYEAGLVALLKTIPKPDDEETSDLSQDILTSLFSQPSVQAEMAKLVIGYLPDQRIIADTIQESGYDLTTLGFDLETGIVAFAQAFWERAQLESELSGIVQSAQLKEVLDSLQEINELVVSHHRSFTEIRSGPAEVIASGTVIAFAGNPVEITFGPPEERLRLVFAFRDEEELKGNRIEANILDQMTLELTLVNFNNPLGAGTVQPMSAGNLAGRQLYIHLRVYGLRDSDRTIHYSIYLGEEVEK